MKRYVLAGLLVTSVPMWAPDRQALGRCRHRVRQPRRADDSQCHGQCRDARGRRRIHAARAADPGCASTLPAFCRVEATARPTSDSEIKFEVWIPPVEAWNGKFQGVGNGGYQGSISYAAMANALRRGYATASTDTGHTGDDVKFGQGHPEKVIDYGWRAIHVMTDTAKLIVRNAQGRFAEQVVLRRLLGRRTPGDVGGAALPGGLRRHRRRRAGEQPHPPDVRVHACVDRHAQRRRIADPHGAEARARHQGRGRRVRCERHA